MLLDKVNLKNNTYKAAISKLEAQLAHKEKMGEVLHLVDFDQLKIENHQYMETIDAKNKELLQLKLASGKTVQASGGGWRGLAGCDAPAICHFPLLPFTASDVTRLVGGCVF